MRHHKSNSFRRFELLEDRRMMTGDISYSSSSHTLTINGGGYDDVAVVRFEGNRVYADLTSAESAPDDDGEFDTDEHEYDKRISDITKIVFNGFAGDDSLSVVVNQLSSGTTLNNILLEFHGGDNDDQLLGSMHNGVKTIAFGDAGNDILVGSKYDDVFEGGTGDDEMSGGGGNDKYVFAGSADLGTDSILNEAANVNTDTLDLTNLGVGADVNLAAVFNPNAANPKYAVNSSILRVKLSDATAIENAIGTAYADTFIGNARDNNFKGGGSDDEFLGAGGNDTLEGGAGNDTYFFKGGNLGTDTIVEVGNADRDTLDFTDHVRGVTVDLTKFGTSLAVNSADLKLKFSSGTAIEDVIGTQYDDSITGNSRNNEIWGYYGKDTISGGAGADELHGEWGDDKLITDALDHAFGGMDIDRFDKHLEPHQPDQTPTNPFPGRYMDWGQTGLPEVEQTSRPRASGRIPTLLG